MNKMWANTINFMHSALHHLPAALLAVCVFIIFLRNSKNVELSYGCTLAPSLSPPYVSLVDQLSSHNEPKRPSTTT